MSIVSKYVLIGLAIVGIVQALLLGGVGVVVGYYLGSVLSKEMTTEPSLKPYKSFFDNVEIPAQLQIKVMAQSTGNMLATVGVVQCVANIIAIYCLLKESHLPLLCYIILIAMSLILQIMCLVYFIHRTASTNISARSTAKILLTTINKEVLHNNEDPWAISFNLIMVVFECCGVDGPKDFQQLTEGDEYVPSTCCTSEFIHNATTQNARAQDRNITSIDLTECTNASPEVERPFHKQKGCFNAVFDTIDSYLSIILSLAFPIFFTQVGSICAAIYYLITIFRISMTTK